MKVLMISDSGDGLGIGHQLVKDGHSVRVYIQDKEYKLSGMGIIERVDSWRPNVIWSDLIIVDMVGFGKYTDVFIKRGKPVIGCSAFCDAIELDRKKGMELFRRTGIKIPKTYSFGSVTEYISSDAPKEKVVLKPDGNIATSKTYVCETEDIVNYALSTYDKNQKFIVQEIVDGIEISTEGWFNGRNWIKPFNHTFEKKRFLNGDLGQNTGCAGNIVITSKGNKIIDETLLKLTSVLRKVSYRGPFDINCIVNKDGIYALEPTPRFGYDAIEAIMEGLSETIGDLLFETAAGVKKEMIIGNDYLIAVRLSVPPYPMGSDGQEGAPIGGLNKYNLPHIFLTDAYRDKGEYKIAMGDGVVLKATARGRSIREAQKRVYRTLDKIVILDKQYRTDIGDGVQEKIDQLKVWGYL